MFTTGATFDRYRIEAELGRGGMGRVYRAFDRKLHRQVALKVLMAPELAEDERVQAVARLVLEARAAAALNHPNVVSIFDVGEASGVAFIAMELIEGRQIGDFAGDATVPWDERLRWMLDVAAALGAAHAAGLIHRDVKPANVIVRARDQAVKVLDFGIVRFHPLDVPADDNGPEGASVISGSRILGTPPYMAPEQILGEPLDGRADQFAWGVTAYELLSGRLPWSATGGPLSFVGKILTEPLAPLEVPGIPPKVSAAIMRTLSKRPADRFSTMEDLVDELSPFVGAAPDSRLAARQRASSTSFLQGPAALRSEAVTVPVEGPLDAPDRDKGKGAATHSDQVTDDAAAGEATPRPPARGRPDPTPPAVGQSMRPARSRRRWLVPGAALFALAVAATAFLTLRAISPPAPAPSSSGAPAGAAPTTVMDLPAPAGCSPEATAAYSEGMRRLRDGNYEQATVRFVAAADADPGCAAAQMRLVVTCRHFLPAARTTTALQRAIEQRDMLSDRDQGLLSAFQPLLLQDPPDRDELSSRLVQLAERFPGDAEIQLLMASSSRAPLDARLAAARRAVEIDPAYSDGWQNLAKLLDVAGKDAEALAALGTCIDVAALSTDCLWQRAELLRSRGRCAKMETDARGMVARSPTTSQGYRMLAEALASQGLPRETVEEALEQQVSRLPAAEREAELAFARAHAAALAGAFDDAEASARALDRLVQANGSVQEHAMASRLLLEVLLEIGKDAEAGQIALDFTRRRPAWTRRVDAFTTRHREDLFDEPRLIAASRDAGDPQRAWEGALADWQKEAAQSAYTEDRATLWAIALAMPARDASAAADAIAAFPGGFPPEGAPPLTFQFPGFPYAFTGRALFLTGRIDDAVSYLQRAVSPCLSLDEPFVTMRSHLWLGEALDRKGDRDGACAAYAVVIKRWRAARPRSVTALEAARRAAALGCAPVDAH